ncbi:ric8 guanine nucleotide exchange factor A [Haematobia irritans]|uniref:ric8 guanine nucleotide exchange factor A n=1 Tax=Haematobia irritans TaxID=7368 RepID=UPI003F5065D3
MDEEHIKYINEKNAEKFPKILQTFNEENANLFQFEKFHNNDLWVSLWKAVFSILNDVGLEKYHIECLNTIRILSRDESSLLKNNIVPDVGCLLNLAHLSLGTSTISTATTPDSDQSFNVDIVVEALKCLCNLVFQNPEVRRECVRQNVVDLIFQRLSSSSQTESSIELFDMKLLFLITALDTTVRSRVLIELNGLTYLTELLDEKLRNISEFSDEQFDILIELLKVLFNVTSMTDKSPSENEIQSLHLTSVIRDLLLRFGAMSTDRERSVVSHSIDLLTNISSSCLSELMIKCEGATLPSDKRCIFENRNVTALESILRYLHYVLEDNEKSSSTHKELVQPVLAILVKCVSSNPIMRHYVRSVILPPLRDVYTRPEEGNELRNYLCRLQATPNVVVRNLTYELLLVCCKKNQGRLIKYFGYGNMAGLFANAGLMSSRKVENMEFSSDSDNSDTEEYNQMEHAINPVVGCYMPPAPNPLEGMTEEQKEYEAERLATLVDQLDRCGIIKPCRINADGKPEPVDHILQLQEELPQQQMPQKGKK